MQEALHSFNVKFRFRGFECQLTIRDDEQGTGKIVTQAQAVVTMLAGLVGVTPTNGNGHAALGAGHPQDVLVQPFEPVCPVCGKSDQLELVPFVRNGKPRQAYKCQRCSKWLPDKK
jgi:hypothetical protein